MERGEIKRRNYVWRKKKQEDDDNKVIATYKSSRFSVCIWGAIQWDKKLALIILDFPGTKKKDGKVIDKGEFTGPRYIEQVLEKVGYNLWTNKMMNDGNDIWIEDNSKIHTSKVVREWRTDHPMRMMDHPPQSPDLNPTSRNYTTSGHSMEYGWHYLKRSLEGYSRIPKNKKELGESLMSEWNNMPNHEIEKFTHSMHDRCQAVIDAHGGHTRY